MASQETQIPENLKARLKESYDAMAPAYNAWTEKRSPSRMTYVEKLLELLPTSQHPVSVLELGSGAGVPVAERLLTIPNLTITANDLSSTQIRLGKEKFGDDRVTWMEGDMMKLDFPDDCFDMVIACYSIQHLPREEQTQMLGKIAGWLKKGGHLLVNFQEAPSTGFVMEKWLHEKGWTYSSGWGADASLDKIKQAGLDVHTANIESDDVRARFLWVIASKL